MQTEKKSRLSLNTALRFAASAALVWIPLALGVSAQEPAQETGHAVTAAAVVPQQVRHTGKLAVRAGETVEAEFRIYAAPEGGEPLWTEAQQVQVQLDGSYSALLGVASPAGLPQTVFAGGAARWLGVSVDRSPEQERVLLSSVPYAMKSADAESLAGHAASDFVTQEQLAALAAASVPAAQASQSAAASPEAHPDGVGPINGVGTTNTIALFTGANAIGNSEIVQSGSDIGINEATPAATLDVGGTANVRGMLSLPATGLATTGGGKGSQPLELSGSAWSTTVPGPVAQNFALEASATGNNTATPGGSLALLYSSGTNPLTATGFSISSNGHINFANGQTFPATLANVVANSPLTAVTTSGVSTIGLSTGVLETSLNSVYPQLTAANTFHSSQTIDGGLTLTSTLNGTYATLSGSLTSYGAQSTGTVLLKSPNTATAASGYNSPVFMFSGSAYNSGTSAAVNQNFSWQAVVQGNNTATPSANLALLAGSGGGNQAPTGLSITPKGVINFVASQTFPGGGGGGGTITGITTSSPLTGSGTSGSVALGLNTGLLLPAITPPLETTFNTIYPQLGAQNSFTNNNAFSGTISSQGTIDLVSPGVTSSFAPNLNSALLELSANGYNSTQGLPEALNFGWLSVATGGNTGSPSANLELLYGSGSAQPAATGLSIAPSGIINFASGQTFPGGGGGGSITGITTSSPLAGSGTSGSVALGLNETTLISDITPTLETTLNSVYAQLGTGNVFTSSGSFADGVLGFTTTGAGVYGTATGAGYAGYFINNTTASSAVYAEDDATGNPGLGIALKGYVPNASSIGVLGKSAGANSYGVFGENVGGSDSFGVYASASGPGSTAIYGAATGGADGNSITGSGVVGISSSGNGVEGTTLGSSNIGAMLAADGTWGVWGDTSGVITLTFSAGILGTADDSYAGFFENNGPDSATINVINDGTGQAALFDSKSTAAATMEVTNSGTSSAAEMANFSSTAVTLYLSNNSTGGIIDARPKTIGPATGALFKTLMASTPTGTCGLGGNGDLSCTGQIKSLVSTGDGERKVETYAPQSAENWMEDYGTGVMERGVSVVKIDPAFADTISQSADYHVFITPRADSKGLYVINATPASFEVRESGGGTSSLTFDYKIVARRRGYEAQRLIDVTDRFNEEQARSLIGRAHGAPVPAATPPRPREVDPAHRRAGNGAGPNGVQAKAAAPYSPVPHARPTGGRVVGNYGPANVARP